ncbi:MAG: hypothetical protein L6Q71_04950 [Planctomycetes bacterium]|nr:hypothetical protein [Planctomycetota bacterium]NUQ33346.1 hypothetical protein [Planctomycetaceae bacterium]
MIHRVADDDDHTTENPAGDRQAPAGMTACAQCVYWAKIDGRALGGCRRGFPRTIAPMQDALKTVTFHGGIWPITGASDWCGDGRGTP